MLGLIFTAGPAEDCEERAGAVNSKQAHSDERESDDALLQ